MVDPIPNEEGLRTLGQQIARSAGRGTKRHRKLKRTLLVVGVVLVLVVGGAAGYGWYLNNEVNRVNVNGLSTGVTKGAAAGTENILMVGSTSRCALKVQNPAYGLCTQGVTGVNSDVIMILHLDPSVPSVSILSLPRDLFIPNARVDGAHKIDAALYQGPTQLVAAIEEDFGIPIQHYVELNFDTFAGVVTALGGITMFFPEPVFDAESGLNVRTPGCHHLNGVAALQVVRARHLQYKGPGVTATTPHTWPQEAQSDLARIRRDHEFLRVLATAVSKRGLANPLTDQQLVSAVAPQLTVDSGFSASHMVNLVLTYHTVSIGSSPQMTLPVLVGQFGTYSYKGGHYGTVEFPTEAADQSVIDKFLGVTGDANTMAGGLLPSPGSVTVSVLNGTGVNNQATTTAAALGRLGFKIVGTGTATPVGREAETLVTYSHRTPVDEAAAQLVARSLSGSVVMAYGPTTGPADVTVTTGTNFSVNPTAPAPAAPQTGSHPKAPAAPKGASTTTTTSGSTGAATAATAATASTGSAGATGSAATSAPKTTGFAPVTTATQSLRPWDPRSCAPGGRAGP